VRKKAKKGLITHTEAAENIDALFADQHTHTTRAGRS
jgi:hypothetical protein